jgi:hypothetical protein
MYSCDGIQDVKTVCVLILGEALVACRGLPELF